MALHFNKFESSPWPKDVLCQVWLKLAQWFGRRRFSNFCLTRSNIHLCVNDKRPMAHIAHRRNKFKSISTFVQSYDIYHNIDLGKKKPIVSFLRTEWFLFVESYLLKDSLCQVRLKTAKLF